MVRHLICAMVLLVAACTAATPVEPGPSVGQKERDAPPPAAQQWLGTWRILSVDGQPVKSLASTSPQPPATLTIRDAGVSVYAGCNHGGGPALLVDNTLYVHSIIATQMGCGDLLKQEERVFSIMTSQPRLIADGAKRARLQSATGVIELERMAVPVETDTQPQTELLPLAGTRWAIESIDGVSLPRIQRNTSLLSFDIERWSLKLLNCATVSGAWTQSGPDRFTATHDKGVAVPACAEAAVKAITSAPMHYRGGHNYEWIAAGGGHWMIGSRSRGHEQQAMKQLVGQWQIIALHGKPVSPKVRSLNFTPSMYSVDDGCAHQEGLYIARGANLFWRGSGMVTAAVCPHDPEAAAMLERLGSSVAFAGPDKLRLISTKGSADYVRTGSASSNDDTSARLAPAMRFRMDNGADLHIIDNRRLTITLPCGTIPGEWNSRTVIPQFSLTAATTPCENDATAQMLGNLFSGPVQVRIGPNKDIALFVGDHGAQGAAVIR